MEAALLRHRRLLQVEAGSGIGFVSASSPRRAFGIT
jgi:hypothetical protein